MSIPQWAVWGPVWMVWLLIVLPLFSLIQVRYPSDGHVDGIPVHGYVMLGIASLTFPSLWLCWCGDQKIRKIYYRYKLWRNS